MKAATCREKAVLSDLVGDLMTGIKKHRISTNVWWCSNSHLRTRARRVAAVVLGRNYVGENVIVDVPTRVGCSWDAAVDYRCNEFSIYIHYPDACNRDKASITFTHFGVESYTPR